MKWKLFLRKNTLSAPKVSVRSHMSWPVRTAITFLLMVAAAVAGLALYDWGRHFGGPNREQLVAQVASLRSALHAATAERDRDAMKAAALQGQVQVEKAAQDQLMLQVRNLDADRARMQADLDFFESLLPVRRGEKGVVIRSFRVEPEGTAAQMHYRLLVQQAGRPQRDFVGSVQLRVTYVQNGRFNTLWVPAADAPSDARQMMQLSFRNYQRLEGSFTLPTGARLQSVQVRILAGGTVRLRQTFAG